MNRRLSRVLVGFTTLLVCLALAMPAWAQSPLDPTRATTTAPKNAVSQMFAGSVVSYRNEVATRTFSAGSELSYNPYYAMVVGFEPLFALGKYLPKALSGVYARAAFAVTSEVTQADSARQQTLASDIDVAVGGSLYRIPMVDIGLAAELGLSVPTSLSSQAEGRLLEGFVVLSSQRRFDWRKGLNLALNVAGVKGWNEYTTSGTSYTRETRCAMGLACVDEAVGSGVRNVDWLWGASLSSNLGVFDWLSVGLSLGVTQAHLYEIANDPRVSLMQGAAQNTRYFLRSGAVVIVKPHPTYAVVLGASSSHEQLAQDGTYRTPFANRFLRAFAEVRFNMANLYDAAQGAFVSNQ